jgi:DNA-binding transcriptional LysR family regulator
MLDWNDLRTVLAISRARGAGEAAQVLGVHPSTVFRRLNALEASLGVRLFDHLPEGYVPTAAGEEVCALAERMEADIAVLDRRLAGRDLRPSGTVRVTTTDTLVGLLTPRFAEFREAHPEIALHVVVANRFFDLTRHDADVALRPTNDPPANLVGRRLATIATAIYASGDYLAAHRGTAELSQHDWIVPDESLAHLAAARWLRRTVPGAADGYRVNSLMAALDAAKAGLGLAALPCYLADREPALVRVRPPLAELDVALWILTHEDLRHVARVRAFLDAMASGLAREKRLLEGTGGPQP